MTLRVHEACNAITFHAKELDISAGILTDAQGNERTNPGARRPTNPPIPWSPRRIVPRCAWDDEACCMHDIHTDGFVVRCVKRVTSRRDRSPGVDPLHVASLSRWGLLFTDCVKI